jgi:hypothetical protein
VSKELVALAQSLIERDDRNVHRRRRKAARRSWYKIPPWALILKAVILGKELQESAAGVPL